MRLSPGFATVFQFDGPITRVAIGEERLVAAHVSAEQGDLTIKPLQPSGRTNMMVWVGTVITLWELLIIRDGRTADLVQVITQVPSLSPSPEVPSRGNAGGSKAPTPEGQVIRRPSVPQFLQTNIHKEGVEAVFQAARLRWGVLIRYRIRNASDRPLRMESGRILVRASGTITPFALVRGMQGSTSQTTIPPRETEVGVLTIGTITDAIQVIIPLFPPSGTPIVLEATFSGISKLPTNPAP